MYNKPIKFIQWKALDLNLDIQEAALLVVLYDTYRLRPFILDQKFILDAIPMLSYTKKDTLNRRIASLCKKGIIEKINSDDFIVGLLKSKKPSIIKIKGAVKCNWCKGVVVYLQEHHHPIRACDGGKDIVRICPSCHYEYHYLKMTGILKLSKTVKSLIPDARSSK